MSIINILKNIPLFAEMTEDDLLKIKSIMNEKTYKKGESIFFETDCGDFFYVVLEGKVKIYEVSFQGQIKAFDFLKEGDFFGEMSLIDNMPRSANALAKEKTRLLGIDREKFRQFLFKNPPIMFKITKTLCRRLRRADLEIELMTFSNVKSRLVLCLINMMKKYGKDLSGKKCIPAIFTHKELSEFVGTSREVISRLLKEIKEEGLIEITNKKDIIIPAVEPLEKLLYESH
ncbi:MAG: Crp/Fnr family transcriptional regulator [Elusimicrobiota bacterium]